jgi:hypothetical protein
MSFDDCFDDLVPQGTVRFTLDGVLVRSTKPAVLVLKHAGEANAPYFNARAKIDAQLKATTGDVTGNAMRPLLIPIFAKHVIAGWDNVNDEAGKPLAFNATVCAAFLTSLAAKRPDIVDRAFVFAMIPDNFTGQIDAEALGNG